MAKKASKLDLGFLNKANKQYDKKRKVDIPVEIEGKTQLSVLEIDEIFKPSKVRACVEELLNRLDVVRKTNESHLQDVLEAFLIFLLIKHFTSFPAPVHYKEQVKVIQMLIETGLLYTIFAQFDFKEIEKVMSEVQVVADRIDENVDEFSKMASDMGFGTDDEDEKTGNPIAK
jgi:hypothetical protein